MRCIIVEDQPPAQRILKKFLKDVGSFELVGVFSDGINAMNFLKSEPADLMFLDIHLPNITGIELLKSLQNPPYVILTTAFSEYALESYELNVVDYLLKPFSFQRFLQAINKVPKEQKSGASEIQKNLDQKNLEELYIKSGHEFLKVSINEIISIQSDSDYTEIQLSNKKILSNEPLRHRTEVLDAKQSLQLHKSHIVNTNNIDRISSNVVHMKDGSKIPIGRAYKEDFIKNVLN